MASALFAERQPYDRYQSVVDRQMFGPPPPGFDPTKPPSEISAKDARAQEQELTKEQEQVKSAIHFSMVNVTPSGDTAVGFTDNSDSKSPKHYYLKVGESRDGWTVKEADALKATMTIAKGDIEVSLELGGNSAGGGGTTAKAGGAGAASRPSGANAFGGRPGGLLSARAGAGASRGLGSLRERRALREQQRAADAQAAAEKEAQREQERAAEKARQEQEKAQHEQEREEQRAQLMQIQEELRKAREARAKAEEEKQQQENAEEKEGNVES